MYARGKAMGQEFYDQGIVRHNFLGARLGRQSSSMSLTPSLLSTTQNIAFSPVAGGPLGRAVLNGRTYEGGAADPYGAGQLAYYDIKGLQDSGVIATAKHFLMYEQETFSNRFGQPPRGGGPSNQLPYDSVVDDKTTHELYLRPFAEAVRAGVGATMCSCEQIGILSGSLNLPDSTLPPSPTGRQPHCKCLRSARICHSFQGSSHKCLQNGTHACANSETLNGLLKTELNFQGMVLSDYGGTFARVLP